MYPYSLDEIETGYNLKILQRLKKEEQEAKQDTLQVSVK